MKIAVVGSGIAGLSAAWLLGRAHDVTLFEKHDHLGMDARSLDVVDESNRARIDVPLRVFFSGFYPNLTALYQQLGIQSEAINYAASFGALNENSYFRYSNYRLGRRSVPFLKGAGSFKPKALRIGWEILRLSRKAPKSLADGIPDEMTLEDYLAENDYSKDFAEGFLYPAYAAICTCSHDSVKAYPARVILEYINSGLLLSAVRRVTDGTQEVVKRLSSPAKQVHLRSQVVGITRTGDGVSIRTPDDTETFDHVVVAAQANQAVQLLEDPSTDEQDVLDCFTYEPSRVIVHTDPRLAPPGGESRWAPVNFLLAQDDAAPMATIWMNAIQEMPGPRPIFQTWNPVIEPEPSRVLGQAEFERPIVNATSLRGLKRLATLHQQPDRRIWFCGSYASHGIPLLESAVKSAMAVAENLGVACPWHQPTIHSRPPAPARDGSGMASDRATRSAHTTQ
ncbi:MAG: FAD-dependent oxidoreductase [Pseudomonadota bacterium]